MALCEHEYIAKVLGFTIQDEIHVGIIMPLYSQSLENFLKDDENQPLKFLDALRFVWQTASVRLFIHFFIYIIWKNDINDGKNQSR